MKKKTPLGIAYTALILILLYAPIIVMIVFSFNSSRSTSVMTGFSLKWYRDLLYDSEIIKALYHSLTIAFLSASIATVLGTMACVGIERMTKKSAKSLLMNVTNIPMMNPDIVTGISMLLLFTFSGVVLKKNDVLGFWTLLITHITFNLPYVILSILPKLRQMDAYLSEAAYDLGCTPAKAFFKVVLPSIKTGIISGFLMAITLSIDDFVISYFVTGSSWQTLPVKIYSMTKRFDPTVYALSTTVFFVILILLILKNFFQSKSEKRSIRGEKTE